MADQTQRLEIATVRAEVGSNIVFRFANDAANAGSIPTQSGDIQNLKQVVLEIQQDAAEKISISTTIYPSVAAGLAATADQGIFLVQSNDADEIYKVWQNQGGTAVNTGKTALSATAIQTALDESNQAAQAAEDAADVAIERTARYLLPSDTDPTHRDNGLPLQVGDIYFNTSSQSEYIYSSTGWQANESLQAIADLKDRNDPAKGAREIGYMGATAADALDKSQNNHIQNNHKKKLLASLPLVFPDYMKILSDAGYNNSTGYIYPGSFAVDEISREIFIVNGSSWTGPSIISVFDLDTHTYKGYFRAVESIGEGVEVLYDYGVRKFFMADRQFGNLYEYDMPVTPLNGQVINQVAIRALGLYNQFSYKDGLWMVEENSADNGQYVSRNVHAIYNKDFVRIGTFYTDIRNTGYVTKSLNSMAPNLNKRQGFAMGRGYVVCSYGGAHDGSSGFDVIEQQGTRLLSMDGQRVQESMMDPIKFKAKLGQALGFGENYNRIENEGVKILSDGSIVSLYVHKTRFDSGANSNGLILVKEYSDEIDSIDYSGCSVSRCQSSSLFMSKGIFPRSPGGIYNPMTGEKFATIDQICEYMMQVQQTEFSFYAGSVSIKDFDGTDIVSGYYKITNANGLTFFVDVETGGAPIASWSIITAGGPGGSRSKSTYSKGVSILKVQGSPSDLTNKFNRIVGGHYQNSEESILVVDSQSSSSANLLIMGGGSGTYNAATQIRLFTASSPTQTAGTEKWRIDSDGSWRPGLDNAYSIGQASFRPSVIYAGSGTINVSDEDAKTDICDIPDEVLDAWREVKWSQFRYRDAVAAKGDNARIHVNAIAQQIKGAFEKHGLDPFRYGVLCYDEWDEQPEVLEQWGDEFNENGDLVRKSGCSVVQPYRAAGKLYGVRYEEALCLEAALMRRTIMDLEERISNL